MKYIETAADILFFVLLAASLAFYLNRDDQLAYVFSIFALASLWATKTGK